MTKNNNVVKFMKVRKIEREDKYEEKREKIEARKQASRDKRWARIDHERY